MPGNRPVPPGDRGVYQGVQGMRPGARGPGGAPGSSGSGLTGAFSGRNLAFIAIFLLVLAAGVYYGISKRHPVMLNGVVKQVENQNVQGPIESFDPFIVNIARTDAERYLKVSISIELTTPSAAREVKTKLVRVRDVIINVLTSKTLPELDSQKGKEELRRELIQVLNNVIDTGKVRNVFFTDFVIQ
ncbi:MAG TPA: hypothetical protein GXX51_00150 [Firmicutes bacterium]|nr:hypothetical protein [Bacillota bacterium]